MYVQAQVLYRNVIILAGTVFDLYSPLDKMHRAHDNCSEIFRHIPNLWI